MSKIDFVAVNYESLDYTEILVKSIKKYVKDYETGEFIEIPRSEIKRLKEEGSYTTEKKIKKQNE